jgi:hypothetical protein
MNIPNVSLSLQDRIETLIFGKSLDTGYQITGVADIGDEYLQVRLTSPFPADGRAARVFEVRLTEIPDGD